MNKSLEPVLTELVNRHPKLKGLEDAIAEAVEVLIHSYKNGGKLLVCGNGGSTSDADHLVGELMNRFEKRRPVSNELANILKEIDGETGKFLTEKLQGALPAISLSAQTALITSVSNDIHADIVYAQQVNGYGNPGDVLIGISTSGNSENVLQALIVAKAKGLKTIGLTGESGGRITNFCDVLIAVPENRTAYVQELHLPVIHAICLLLENYFFK